MIREFNVSVNRKKQLTVSRNRFFNATVGIKQGTSLSVLVTRLKEYCLSLG